MATTNPKDRPATSGPKPGYFIVRKTGEVVPLIAVDELPLGVDLIGVPRSLDLIETSGMLNLGLQNGDGKRGFYRLVGLDDEDDDSWSSGSSTVVDSPLLLPTRSSTTMQISAPRATSNRNDLSSSMHNPSNRVARNLPSGPPGQQICRHWCIYNRRCRWGEQCHYKHEMPKTRAELNEIGMSDWPGWFKSENPGFFPRGGMVERERQRERERLERVGVREAVEKLGGGGKGEKIMQRLREMERAGKGKREKDGEVKREREKEKEKKREKTKEKEREEGLEIRREEARKEKERLKEEKAREKEAAKKIDRAVVEGTRNWEDDDSSDEDEKIKHRVVKKDMVEKEKLVDV